MVPGGAFSWHAQSGDGVGGPILPETGPPRPHPRVRREHEAGVSEGLMAAGPSPRARGARGSLAARTAGRRSIPACAGSTSAPGGARSGRMVHPRMRGEHMYREKLIRLGVGPSPHARGALEELRNHLNRSRSIPACAGSTRSSSAAPTCWRVHPRMRGEHLSIAVVALNPWGPSPHARGALEHHGRIRASGRSIPACAGSTQQAQEHWGRFEVHPRMRGEHTS